MWPYRSLSQSRQCGNPFAPNSVNSMAGRLFPNRMNQWGF
jgi:hypothetical protein